MANSQAALAPSPEAGPRLGASREELDLDALLSGARQGDRQHVDELLQRYRNYLTLLATTQMADRLRPRLGPSDVVQETMLRAYRNFPRFRGQSEAELLAWLRRILASSLARFVEHNLLAAKRDARREVSIDQATPDRSALDLAALLQGRGQTPSVIAQQGECAVGLAEHLARLSPPYREILVLRHFQGLSFEEASARMNRSLGATRMLWLRAIEKLRDAYRKANCA